MATSTEDDVPSRATDVVLVGAVPDPVVHPHMSAAISRMPPRSRRETL
jgi:hypothetical protein